MRASRTSRSLAVVVLTMLMLFGLSAQASALETRTVTAPNQSFGTKCSEIRLAAAFAYNDSAAFKAECIGYFSSYRNGARTVNPNHYGIRTGAPGTTRRTLYLGKKFYNPTTRKWRIAVLKY